ncbi:hypothetical protein ACIO13_25395 [Streptomyces sp. NPDC087425]|uniref:hypothetical protein n=1 Tax=unclassified Streptomyces TaxID=2593676 RepID=UPI0037F571DA
MDDPAQQRAVNPRALDITHEIHGLPGLPEPVDPVGDFVKNGVPAPRHSRPVRRRAEQPT